jgi:hypothetical protein
MKNLKQQAVLSVFALAGILSIAGAEQAVAAQAPIPVVHVAEAASNMAMPARYRFQGRYYAYRYHGRYFNHRSYKGGHWMYY